MPSERFRKILPYVSIGIGILVYVLYYNSTQSWNEAQSEYERQEVQKRLAKKRASKENLANTKPWISLDAKYAFKIIDIVEKDGLIWIKLSDLNEKTTYNLRSVSAESGEKYISNIGNTFIINNDTAIFENAEGDIIPLKEIKLIRGLYSYMADANSLDICNSDRSVSIALLGDNVSIEKAYSRINRSGENVYLEVEGIFIKDKSMEGDETIDAVYPYKLINMIDRQNCK